MHFEHKMKEDDLLDHEDGAKLISTQHSTVAIDPMDEENERKLYEARYKELSRLFHQLSTRAALTQETYEIAKKAILKMIEEIDAVPDKRTTGSHLGTKSNVKETFVAESRHDAFDHSDSTVDGITLRGLEVKEKKNLKSGKRPKSGLEKASRKLMQKRNSVSSSNNGLMSSDINQKSARNTCPDKDR